MLRLAHPENAWKDVPHKPTYDHIVEADIRGDLNGNQAVAMANALDGIPRLAPTGRITNAVLPLARRLKVSDATSRRTASH